MKSSDTGADAAVAGMHRPSFLINRGSRFLGGEAIFSNFLKLQSKFLYSRIAKVVNEITVNWGDLTTGGSQCL